MFLLYHLDIACHGPNGFDDIKLIIFRAGFLMVFPHLDVDVYPSGYPSIWIMWNGHALYPRFGIVEIVDFFCFIHN